MIIFQVTDADGNICIKENMTLEQSGIPPRHECLGTLQPRHLSPTP